MSKLAPDAKTVATTASADTPHKKKRHKK